ncbi:MAG: zinc ribbon domain-containing protein [Thermomicrobiales bacterium]
MPIYEYRCAACGRKASLFFRSISVVESEPGCPACGQRRLERLMSRVWSRRSSDESAYPEPTFEDDGVPFYGPDPFSDPYGGDGEFGGSIDEDSSSEDVAAMAREARAMAQMMGEPLDREFDDALRHVEHGADPEDVFGEMDENQSAQETREPDGEP